jgi:hypothetical protein
MVNDESLIPPEFWIERGPDPTGRAPGRGQNQPEVPGTTLAKPELTLAVRSRRRPLPRTKTGAHSQKRDGRAIARAHASGQILS